MLAPIHVCYGLSEGDRLEVVCGREKHRVTVITEYAFHILVDMGAYRTSINKIDVAMGSIKLIRKEW